MQIGNIEIYGASPEQEAAITARDRFIRKYSTERGWPENPQELSFEQIIEIRKQDGWKRPSTIDHEV